MTTRSRSLAGSFTGTWALLRLMLRRDRVRFPAWVIGLSMMMVYVAGALGTILDEPALHSFAAFAANPAMALIGGPGYGFEAVTVGKVIVGFYALYLMLGAAGLVFAGVAAVTVQLSAYSRAASGIAGAVMAIAFIVRGFGDMSFVQGGNLGWLSWLSPFGWSQQTAPLTLDRWWPLVMSLATATLLTGIGFTLQARRDFASGMLPDRFGAPERATWLGSPLALAFRLQQATLLWWSFALLLSGIAFDAFAQPMAKNAAGLPDDILVIFGGTEGMIEGYLGFMAVFSAIFVSVFAILTVQQVRTAEQSGRAEHVLATAVSRNAWLLSWVTVAALGAIWLLALAGLGEGLGAAISTGDWGLVGGGALGHLAQTPAVWALIGLAAVLYGWAPRLMGLTWAAFAYATGLAMFGDVLQLSDAVLNSSVFRLIGQYPAQAYS